MSIDFETLPDGSLSVAGTEITDSFNYTAQGATFSSPFDDLAIAGNSIGGFTLRTIGFGTIEDPAYIRADLSEPGRSFGYFFPGSATFEAFDQEGGLLASEFFAGSGSGFFLGVTSETPIGYVLMDEVAFEPAGIESFHFAPVPEPATAGLLGLGALWALWRRRRRPGVG